MKFSYSNFAIALILAVCTNSAVYATEYSAAPGSAASEPHTGSDTPLYLRANLLRWATLTPDLGIGWRITDRWTLTVNATYTSWGWNNKERRYALWEVAPEVRYHIGEKRNWYVGAMFKAGSFNYKFTETGKQGDIIGGGITGGYILKLNKRLCMDFGIGIGCIHAKYDRYKVIDDLRVRQGKDSSNWLGPVSAGITLVWSPF